MDTSSLVVDKAQQLAAAGRHAEVVSYLGARKGTELADSPSLALLYGTAQARLGRHEEGLRWVDLALDQAHKRDEQAVERHALNARGAIALVSGRIDEADRKSTRLNSSHGYISYAVFCLKKKKNIASTQFDTTKRGVAV